MFDDDAGEYTALVAASSAHVQWEIVGAVEDSPGLWVVRVDFIDSPPEVLTTPVRNNWILDVSGEGPEFGPRLRLA